MRASAVAVAGMFRSLSRFGPHLQQDDGRQGGKRSFGFVWYVWSFQAFSNDSYIYIFFNCVFAELGIDSVCFLMPIFRRPSGGASRLHPDVTAIGRGPERRQGGALLHQELMT